MNDIFYYLVPGILAFFVVWIFFRFLVKKDIGKNNAFLFLGIIILLLALLFSFWLMG